jgi:hypothetical protein
VRAQRGVERAHGDRRDQRRRVVLGRARGEVAEAGAGAGERQAEHLRDRPADRDLGVDRVHERRRLPARAVRRGERLGEHRGAVELGADALAAALVGAEAQLGRRAAVDAEVGQRAAADAGAVDVDVEVAVAARGDDQVDEAPGRRDRVGGDAAAGGDDANRAGGREVDQEADVIAAARGLPVPDPPVAGRSIDLDVGGPGGLAQVAERGVRRAQIARAADVGARPGRAGREVRRGAAAQSPSRP